MKLRRELADQGGFGFWAKLDCKDSVDRKNLSEYWKQVLMQVRRAPLENGNLILQTS